MKAARDFITVEDPGRGNAPAGHSGAGRVEELHSAASLVSTDSLKSALALLREVSATAVEDAALRSFQAASDFAGTVEEASRILEHLQLVAAGSVDRTRTRAAAAASRAGASWTTGWRDTTPGVFTKAGTRAGSGAGAAGPDSVAADAAATGAVDAPAASDGSASAGCPAPPDSLAAADDAAVGVAAAVDDGYRNTTEFLRARLRISAPRGPPPSLPRRGPPAEAGIRRRTPACRPRRTRGRRRPACSIWKSSRPPSSSNISSTS